MCTVMIVDGNKTSRNWIRECVSESNLKTVKTIICDSAEEATGYIGGKCIDILLTRVAKEDASKIKFIEDVHKKYLFSTVLAYGTHSDYDFLCQILSSGVSQYMEDIFDKNKLKLLLNDAYQRYCLINMKLNIIIKKESGNHEKAYSSDILRKFVLNYSRCACKSMDKNINAYIEMMLDVIDSQPIAHSKSMVIELMILLAESENMGFIKTNHALFNSKNFSLIMKISTVTELKDMVKLYLKKLAMNIFLFSNENNYKSLMIVSAIKYINNNYRRDISRDDVAAAVNLNPSYFSKLFKEQTGESFVSYLRRIRMEEAKYILETTDQTIKEVSKQVGYADSKYFAKLFYNYTESTPHEYKESVIRFMA